MKALIAGLVVALAGAGFGGAVLTGTLPLMTANTAEPEPGTGWEVLETFTGEAGDVTEGTLDLRAFWGTIQVTGWDQPGYELTVYQRAPDQGGQRLSDAGIEAVFEESREAGLGLSLVVQRTGSYDVHVNEDSWTDIAIVANVPSTIAWTTAFVCTGEDGPARVREALMPVLGVVWEGGEDEEQGCVAGNPIVGMDIGRISIQDDEAEEEAYAFPFALANLHGGELMVHAQYANLALENLAFAKADVMTQYGDVLGSIDAPELSVMTQYGTIGLVATTDAADIMSQYGDLHLAFGAGSSGAYNVMTQYGDLTVGVPSAPDRGYDVAAETQYGELLVILDGIEYTNEEEDEGAAPATALKAGLPLLNAGGVPKGRDHDGSSRVEAQSEGFDAAPVQVVIKALTQYGDGLITDGALPEAEEDEDQN